MRTAVTEELNETRYLDYEYDELNRLTYEYSDSRLDYNIGDPSPPSDLRGYKTDYIYDLVGNRKTRIVSVENDSGDCTLTTSYVYNQDTDRLESESHSTSGTCAAIQWDSKDRVYVYADAGGRLSYKLPGREKHIGYFAAFLLGLPSVWSKVLLIAAFILVPVTFFAPVIFGYVKRLSKTDAQYPRSHLSLYHRCMCVLLALSLIHI